MKLTRRDAIAALAATGVAVGGGGAVLRDTDGDLLDAPKAAPDSPLDDAAMASLVAAARVLYPSEIEQVEAFVTRYARGRAEARPAHAAGMAEAAAYLDEYAESWYDSSFVALDGPTRETLFRRMDLDTADPSPDGSDVERVRYYVVNELLFALYASPTGAALVGLENPQGHPGGLSSYQRGPPS